MLRYKKEAKYQAKLAFLTFFSALFDCWRKERAVEF